MARQSTVPVPIPAPASVPSVPLPPPVPQPEPAPTISPAPAPVPAPVTCLASPPVPGPAGPSRPCKHPLNSPPSDAERAKRVRTRKRAPKSKEVLTDTDSDVEGWKVLKEKSDPKGKGKAKQAQPVEEQATRVIRSVSVFNYQL